MPVLMFITIIYSPLQLSLFLMIPFSPQTATAIHITELHDSTHRERM